MAPMNIKTAAGPRPFWEGLDPDKPEPLDKIIAALHCYHVRPPAGGQLRFTFTVDKDDYHRIHRGFPELKKLAAAIRTEIPFEFDPSTGKLTTMDAKVALMDLKAHVYYLVASGIESARRLPEPVGLLARKVRLGHDENCLHGFYTAVNSHKNIANATSIFVFATAGNHKGTGTYAQYFIKYPETMRTVVAVNLGLPDNLDSDRAVRRLAKFSFVSVFAVVDGKVKAVVQREPLSTPGANHHLHHRPANITIPYSEILSSLRGTFAGFVDDKPTNGPVLGGGGSSRSNLGSGNKHSFSTLAGGGGSRSNLGSGNKHSLSTLGNGNKPSFSTLVGGNKHFFSTLGSGNKPSFSTLIGGNKHLSTLGSGNKPSFSTLAGGNKHCFSTLAGPKTLLTRMGGGHQGAAMFRPRRLGRISATRLDGDKVHHCENATPWAR
ncbi:hypothetical protein B0T25DRAFT_520445 [Lasiosphaeria hispida]|uniref:Uncharacterized protein n=1 Tax=Lasiosphaeria hispida TaxID=260671 RepID=A0AAJ0HA93_9PEZI|nr:hypothetical protein B0T25DRAFT_520445 [Lasiosphaeria hispida]